MNLSTDNRFVFFDFIFDGKVLKNAPVCGMTLKKCGNMRFRWNEKNALRNNVLAELSGAEVTVKNDNAVSCTYAFFTQNKVLPVAVELIHSKKVIDLDGAGQCKNTCDTENKNNFENLACGVLGKMSGILADGIITENKNFMPVVTVADCMPVFLFDKATETFGIVHSGWKGTGIVAEAVVLMCKNHGTRPENISVILGPHIRECCYIVNAERADYFKTEFAPDCVQELEEGGKCFAGGRGLPVKWNTGSGKLYRLSLEKANLVVLKKCGIPFENINIIKECTCCNQIFGSNRRETAEWNSLHSSDEKLPAIPPFTVQAAFIRF